MSSYNTIVIIFFLTIVLPFVCAEIVLICCIIRYTACYSKARVQRRPYRLHLSTKQKRSKKVTLSEFGRESKRAEVSYHHVTGKERAQVEHHNKRVKRNDEIKLKALTSDRNTNTLKSTLNAQLDDCNSPVQHRGSEDRSDNTTPTSRHNTTSVSCNTISAHNVTRTPPTRGEGYRQKAEIKQIEVEIHEYEHSYETIKTRDSESLVYATVTESIGQSHSQHSCLVNKHQSPSHQQRDHTVMTDERDILLSDECLATTFDKTKSPSEKDDEHTHNDSNTPSQQDYTYVTESVRYTCSSKQGESVISEGKESSSQASREPTEILTTTNVAYPHSRSLQANAAEATSVDDSTECRYDQLTNNNRDNQGYYENCSHSQPSNERQKGKTVTDKHTISTSHGQPANSVSLTGTTTYDKWGRLYSDC